MTDLLICLAVFAAACVCAWRVYAPPRWVIYEAVENWGADNKEAAKLRDERRALRRQKKQRPTATQIDNGRVFEVEVR